MNTRTYKQRRHTTADDAANHFTYESSYKLRAFRPPLPLQQGERIEVRGSETARALKLANPHPTLSLRKGEADQSANASNTSQTRSMK